MKFQIMIPVYSVFFSSPETKAPGVFPLFATAIQFLPQVGFLFVQVSADDSAVLDQIVDTLTSITSRGERTALLNKETNTMSMQLGEVYESDIVKGNNGKNKITVLILGAGRVCRPAAELLASIGSVPSQEWLKICVESEFEDQNEVQVIVASLYLKDAEEVSLDLRAFSCLILA